MLFELRYRLRALFRHSSMECELRDELAFHAATSGQAVELESTAEACRDARGISWLENAARDIRYAVRSLRHTSGFTVPALLTLVLGLGAAIAIFSVADAVLVRPLAYRNASSLVALRERVPLFSKSPLGFSVPDIAAARAAGAAFAQIGSFEENQRDLSVSSGPAMRVFAARISANLLPMLGARPLLGHAITPAEDSPGHDVALLSYALWRGAFGADPHVIGRTFQLDGVLYTVAGVMPPSFEFPPRGLASNRPAGVFVPMAFTSAELTEIADNFDVGIIARLRPDATVAEARAQMAIASARIRQVWQKTYPLSGISATVTVDPLRNLVIGRALVLMDLLLGAAGLLLMLSCANAANLFLVRASVRQREWSLRAALGAGRGRLLRQALTESMLLSAAAAATGLLLAWAALRALTAAAPATLPQVRAIGLNGWAVLFAGGMAVLVGPLCGLLPALAAGRAGLEQSLRDDAPSLAGLHSGARIRQVLIVLQGAIAFVLVCGAGLLVRSFVQAESGRTGMQSQNVITAALLLPKARYAQPGQGAAFFDRLQHRLDCYRGVTAFAASTALPTEDPFLHSFTVQGQEGRLGALLALHAPHAGAGCVLPRAWHSPVAGPAFYAGRSARPRPRGRCQRRAGAALLAARQRARSSPDVGPGRQIRRMADRDWGCGERQGGRIGSACGLPDLYAVPPVVQAQ